MSQTPIDDLVSAVASIVLMFVVPACAPPTAIDAFASALLAAFAIKLSYLQHNTT